MGRFIRLTDSQVRKIRDLGRHCVDSLAGLYLAVHGAPRRPQFLTRVDLPDGRRTWRTIGQADAMTLATARLAAERLQAQALAEHQALQEAADQPAAAQTFAQALEAHIERQKAVWRAGGKSEGQWRQSMADYVTPLIGMMRVDQIRPADVVRVLTPIRQKVETARRVRQRIASVIESSNMMAGVVAPNPADESLIERLLPTVRREVRHHPAPTLLELRQAMRWLDDRHASHRCLRFVILHACRSGEARGATWSEVGEGGVWSVPASRMKAGRPWRSPVMWLPFRRSSSLLFEGVRGKQLSDMALLEVVRGKGLGWTPHGVRSTFRSWVAESALSESAAEMQLAHTPSKLEQAYQRSDLLDQRRELLTAWVSVLNGH